MAVINPSYPGVYINELPAFPNSAVLLPTCVPVFIGFTANASANGVDVTNQPVQIASYSDYLNIFGASQPTDPSKPPVPQCQPVYGLVEASYISSPPPSSINGIQPVSLNNQSCYLVPIGDTVFYLPSAIQMFYANGGGQCYIISVGKIGLPSQPPQNVVAQLDIANFQNGVIENNFLTNSVSAFTTALLSIVNMTPQPTLLAIPDMNAMSAGSYQSLLGDMLLIAAPGDPSTGATGAQLAVFDVYGGAYANGANYQTLILNFRNDVTNGKYLSYGAAYFPFIVSTLLMPTWYNNLATGWQDILSSGNSSPPTSAQVSNQLICDEVTGWYTNPTTGPVCSPPVQCMTEDQIQNALTATNLNFDMLMTMVGAAMNTLPAVGSVLGQYNTMDYSSGVWAAPANVGLLSVANPTFNLSNAQQGTIGNVNIDPIAGKSVNAIRFFEGQGTLIWGARTLDGNSEDYRYINVRRTLLNIEQSAELALQAYVFRPNTSGTWNLVQAMLTSMLTQMWQAGGLVGATAAQAFSVQVGMPTTMNAEDVLNGIMRVNISVAISHPAEFIVLTITQQLQS